MTDVNEDTNKLADDEQLVQRTSEHQAAPTAKSGRDEIEAETGLVAKLLRGSANSIVCGAKAMTADLERRKDDDEKARAYIKGLARRRVIPDAEGDQGRSSPTVSKYLKIGANAGTFESEQLAEFLPPSYTALYSMANLYEELPEGDEEKKLKKLVGILKKEKGAVTREFLIRETRRLKEQKKTTKEPADDEQKGSINAASTFNAQLEAGNKFDLAVLTPGKEDLKLLGSDQAEPARLERCFPIHKLMAEAAAIVICGSIANLPMIEGKILPLCGFKRIADVLLAHRPDVPRIIKAQALVVAERGAQIDQEAADRWLEDGAALDPLAIAAHLYPRSVHRLHLFGAAAADGWTCLVDDSAWVEKP